MSDLLQWLGVQLDEDERIAQGACHGGPAEWTTAGSYPVSVAGLPPGVEVFAEAVVFDEGSPSEEQAAHIARHDPARVLREIDAKRQLIARGGPFCTSNCDAPGNEPKDPDTNWTTPLEHHLDCAAYNAATVLALPYSDRPGFREEWRP